LALPIGRPFLLVASKPAGNPSGAPNGPAIRPFNKRPQSGGWRKNHKFDIGTHPDVNFVGMGSTAEPA